MRIDRLPIGQRFAIADPLIEERGKLLAVSEGAAKVRIERAAKVVRFRRWNGQREAFVICPGHVTTIARSTEVVPLEEDE